MLHLANRELGLMTTTSGILKSNKKYCFDPLKDNPNDLPDQIGIYMICAKNKDSLEKMMIGAVFPEMDGLPIIYIGISEKQGLKKRDYRNHFKGTARKSTFRKSLGSLFQWQEDRIYDNTGKYKFNPICEQELTKWMHDNLLIYYWLITDTDIFDLETKLINELDPPMNIAKNKSPVNKEFRKHLCELRN